MAKKNDQRETWPTRDEVSDEDRRQSSNDHPGERARAERTPTGEDRQGHDRSQSKDTDPDSAHATIDRDDDINDDL